MDIQTWFSNSGSYADGLKLYSAIPGCSKVILSNLAKENSSNFLKLKYELKKALMSGSRVNVPEKAETPVAPKKAVQPEPLLQHIVAQSASISFEKETMALYPIELHPTYRQRVNDFYQACELKFQLNRIPEHDDKAALKIILQLEDLWTKIDKAWLILDHWKDHNRIMPVEESEDFSKLNGIQLVKMRNRLESSISKRQKTIDRMQAEAIASPEDRRLEQSLLRKLEQQHQLSIDLETIRNLLKNE